MSDEYDASGAGFRGSLVSRSLDSKDAQPASDSQTSTDTTSQGGYRGTGDSFSPLNQRGSDASSQGRLSAGGTDDQGSSNPPQTAGDTNERGESTGLSDALNPYGPTSTAPASKQSDRREDVFESGPGAMMERDVGA